LKGHDFSAANANSQQSVEKVSFERARLYRLLKKQSGGRRGIYPPYKANRICVALATEESISGISTQIHAFFRSRFNRAANANSQQSVVKVSFERARL
jgi:hypothetical protein